MLFRPIIVGISFSLFFVFADADPLACGDYYSQQRKFDAAHLKIVKKAVGKEVISKEERAELDRILNQTKDSNTVIDNLLGTLKRFELENMYFKVRSSDGIVGTLNLYRNAEFLSSIELVVTDSIPRGNGIHNNVRYGYRNFRHQELSDLGVVPAIEMNETGTIRKVYFLTEKQKVKFRTHFFGRSFSKNLRDRIVNLNTRIFKELSQSRVGNQKVLDFEKSRGWPEGTAQRLGLVYYSKEVLNLKAWAAKNRVGLDDLASAGWLRQVSKSDGKESYTENYDDSIKIPFFDLLDKTKVAFWRTRNLNSQPGLPKYLSWPKDRSLYEGEPLFEELYNGWNLSQAKGKKIVITEGEFKCAIGEIATGIIHLGLPGISQFSHTMLENLKKVQPSEVIVLFDRDPIGKGLVRLDEVTDSQRASYSIAKQIEAVGIPVKVSSLPNVFNGGKVGIDDLVLSLGAKPYLEALNAAQLPDAYAKTYEIDVIATELSSRKNRVSKALRQFEHANTSTLGFISLDQRTAYKKLLGYQTLLDIAYNHYFKTRYPGRQRLTDSSADFDVIAANSLGGRIATDKEIFKVTGSVLKLRLKLSDKDNCTQLGCLELNQTEQAWAKLNAKEKFELISQALVTIFPTDDYTYVESPEVLGTKHLLLIIRKELRSPVAIVDEF